MTTTSTLQISILSVLVAACGGGETPPPASPTPASSADGPAPAGAAEAPPAVDPNRAPDFTLPDLDGNAVSLSSFSGKTVVLEWFNPGCPFVVYAHETGPLSSMARTATASGVVWLAINSGAQGKQGFDVALNVKARAEWSMANPILRDVNGDVGRLYSAKTTPTMVVINSDGTVVYQGALDNAPLGKSPDSGAVNYVEQALSELADGKPVSKPRTKSYGCSVKY